MISFRKAHNLVKFITISALLSFVVVFLCSDLLRAKNGIADVLNLPAPAELLKISKDYSYPMLRGIKINPQDPLKLEFMIDKADKSSVSQKEAQRLVSYFLSGLTVPEEDLWVNLSPYEKERIVPDQLGVTEMGRDLLAQDYVLKQLSSSLTHPGSSLGKAYWEGNREQGIGDSLSKIWIMPESADVLESGTMAFVKSANLKVMSEKEYLIVGEGLAPSRERGKSKAGQGQALSLLIDKITEDVNNGKNFAKLRQIYHSLILATWFKKKFMNSFYENYINNNKVKGIDTVDIKTKEDLFDLYVEAFEKGAYNFVEKEKDPVTGKKQLRHYFSGGFDGKEVASVIKLEKVSSSNILTQAEKLKKVVSYVVRLVGYAQAKSGADFKHELSGLFDEFLSKFTEDELNGLVSNRKKIRGTKRLENKINKLLKSKSRSVLRKKAMRLNKFFLEKNNKLVKEKKSFFILIDYSFDGVELVPCDIVEHRQAETIFNQKTQTQEKVDVVVVSSLTGKYTKEVGGAMGVSVEGEDFVLVFLDNLKASLKGKGLFVERKVKAEEVVIDEVAATAKSVRDIDVTNATLKLYRELLAKELGEISPSNEGYIAKRIEILMEHVVFHETTHKIYYDRLMKKYKGFSVDNLTAEQLVEFTVINETLADFVASKDKVVGNYFVLARAIQGYIVGEGYGELMLALLLGVESFDEYENHEKLIQDLDSLVNDPYRHVLRQKAQQAAIITHQKLDKFMDKLIKHGVVQERPLASSAIDIFEGKTLHTPDGKKVEMIAFDFEGDAIVYRIVLDGELLSSYVKIKTEGNTIFIPNIVVQMSSGSQLGTGIGGTILRHVFKSAKESGKDVAVEFTQNYSLIKMYYEYSKGNAIFEEGKKQPRSYDNLEDFLIGAEYFEVRGDSLKRDVKFNYLGNNRFGKGEYIPDSYEDILFKGETEADFSLVMDQNKRISLVFDDGRVLNNGFSVYLKGIKLDRITILNKDIDIEVKSAASAINIFKGKKFKTKDGRVVELREAAMSGSYKIFIEDKLIPLSEVEISIGENIGENEIIISLFYVNDFLDRNSDPSFVGLGIASAVFKHIFEYAKENNKDVKLISTYNYKLIRMFHEYGKGKTLFKYLLESKPRPVFSLRDILGTKGFEVDVPSVSSKTLRFDYDEDKGLYPQKGVNTKGLTLEVDDDDRIILRDKQGVEIKSGYNLYAWGGAVEYLLLKAEDIVIPKAASAIDIFRVKTFEANDGRSFNFELYPSEIDEDGNEFLVYKIRIGEDEPLFDSKFAFREDEEKIIISHTIISRDDFSQTRNGIFKIFLENIFSYAVRHKKDVVLTNTENWAIINTLFRYGKGQTEFKLVTNNRFVSYDNVYDILSESYYLRVFVGDDRNNYVDFEYTENEELRFVEGRKNGMVYKDKNNAPVYLQAGMRGQIDVFDQEGLFYTDEKYQLYLMGNTVEKIKVSHEVLASSSAIDIFKDKVFTDKAGEEFVFEKHSNGQYKIRYSNEKGLIEDSYFEVREEQDQIIIEVAIVSEGDYGMANKGILKLFLNSIAEYAYERDKDMMLEHTENWAIINLFHRIAGRDVWFSSVNSKKTFGRYSNVYDILSKARIVKVHIGSLDGDFVRFKYSDNGKFVFLDGSKDGQEYADEIKSPIYIEKGNDGIIYVFDSDGMSSKLPTQIYLDTAVLNMEAPAEPFLFKQASSAIEEVGGLVRRSSENVGGIDLEEIGVNIEGFSGELAEIDIDFSRFEGFVFEPQGFSELKSGIEFFVEEW